MIVTRQTVLGTCFGFAVADSVAAHKGAYPFFVETPAIRCSFSDVIQ